MKFLKLQTTISTVQLHSAAKQTTSIEASLLALQKFQQTFFALSNSQKVILIFPKKIAIFFATLEENPRRASAGKLIFS